MRLLHINEDGNFSLVDVIDTKSTPYAILSHTWGDLEITYQELLQGPDKGKPGYKKIRACAKKTVERGLKYFWVDTCCIDKSSSAELSEAINTMYRWYQEAEICFAYLEGALPDLFVSKQTHTVRWFTRGWTLQELLAPKEVVFFDSEWSPLGTRFEHAAALSEITGIHAEALQGRPENITTRLVTDIRTGYKSVQSFSIAQRMSWAARRITTRSEDLAYCLLGIFDVNMPLLYGEGPIKAYVRLQEEIMKDSNDQSLFAWCRRRADINPSKLYSLLAESPLDFEHSASFVPVISSDINNDYAMTNNGLRITLQMMEVERHTTYIALLNCVDSSTAEEGNLVALAFRGHVTGVHGRVAICSIHFKELLRNLRLEDDAFPRVLLCSSKTVYIPKAPLTYNKERSEHEQHVELLTARYRGVYGSENRVTIIRDALPNGQREMIALIIRVSIHLVLANILLFSTLNLIFVPTTSLFKSAICPLIAFFAWFSLRLEDSVIQTNFLPTHLLLSSLITGVSMALYSTLLSRRAMTTISNEILSDFQKAIVALLVLHTYYVPIWYFYFGHKIRIGRSPQAKRILFTLFIGSETIIWSILSTFFSVKAVDSIGVGTIMEIKAIYILFALSCHLIDHDYGPYVPQRKAKSIFHWMGCDIQRSRWSLRGAPRPGYILKGCMRILGQWTAYSIEKIRERAAAALGSKSHMA